MKDGEEMRDALRALIVAHGALEEAERPCGTRLSMPHAHALLELRAGPMRVTELARRLRIDRTNVSRLCQRMEDAGDLTRAQDPDDARARRLELTDQGRALATRVDAQSAAHFARVEVELGANAQSVLTALRALERSLRALSPLLLLTLSLGCQPTPAPPSPTSTPAAPASQPASPHAQLVALDPRAPVPLLPMMAWHQKQNMMDHLLVIQEITAALAKDDWDGVAMASARIASSPKMKQMCEHMGAGAPGFATLATAFHAQADAIAPAARAKDTRAVLEATSKTLQVCTACHQAWRQDVVDHDVWAARTQ